MSLLGGIGSIIGGLFASQGAGKGAKAAVKGARINARAARWASKQNLKYQQLFAKKAIRWKVKDAARAGISPLAALGAQTVSFAPSFNSGNPGDGLMQAGAIRARGAEAMGQGIARAGEAFGDGLERYQEFALQSQKLALENQQLQNAVLASQVANLNQPGTPPPAPSNNWLIDGQGQTQRPSGSVLVKTNPMERSASDPSRLHSEPGAVNDVGYTRTKTGYAPVMSKDAKERYEEDFLGGLTWNLRNRILQNLQINVDPPHEAPAGKVWKYNPLKQEYQLWDEKDLLRSKLKPYDTQSAEEAYRRRKHFSLNTGL